jgi:hypothetical protein
LSVAWEKRLLVQNAFWSRAIIQRFFNANQIVHNPRLVQPDPHWSLERGLADQDAALAVYSSVLPDPVELLASRRQVPEETASWVYHYSEHTEYFGSVQFELSDAADVSWLEVRRAFGPGVVAEPPPMPIAGIGAGEHGINAGLQKIGNWEQGLTLVACYQSPAPLPSKMADWEYDKACFFLKRNSIAKMPQWLKRVWVEPQDDDIVRYVRISEHRGHIPMFCYALNLDSALTDRCPPREPAQVGVVPD